LKTTNEKTLDSFTARLQSKRSWKKITLQRSFEAMNLLQQDTIYTVTQVNLVSRV